MFSEFIHIVESKEPYSILKLENSPSCVFSPHDVLVTAGPLYLLVIGNDAVVSDWYAFSESVQFWVYNIGMVLLGEMVILGAFEEFTAFHNGRPFYSSTDSEILSPVL